MAAYDQATRLSGLGYGGLFRVRCGRSGRVDSQAKARPSLTLGLRPDSGGNVTVACRSVKSWRRPI